MFVEMFGKMFGKMFVGGTLNSMINPSRSAVIAEILAERDRQDAKHGFQAEMIDQYAALFTVEEVLEMQEQLTRVMLAVVRRVNDKASQDALYSELTQMTACGAKWMEIIKRRCANDIDHSVGVTDMVDDEIPSLRKMSVYKMILDFGFPGCFHEQEIIIEDSEVKGKNHDELLEYLWQAYGREILFERIEFSFDEVKVED